MPSPPPRSPPQIRVASAPEQDAMSTSQHSSGGLSDVPEDGPIATPRSPAPSSPYFSPTHQAAASTSTFHRASTPPGSSPATGTNNQAVQSSSVSRRSSGSVRMGREATGSNGSLRKQALAPSRSSGSLVPPRDKKKSSTDPSGKPKIRILPRLPHAKEVELVPTTGMYWSKAPVYGHLPTRGLRANSTTLVDNVVWIFGGCDDTQCWNDVYCFDTETMRWSYPQMMGEIPLPCRAHSATLVDRKIVVFGGGEGPIYFDKTYVLDTITRRWKMIKIDGILPAPRRAHSAVLYKNKIWVFGGGNGMQALNDVWTLDVGNGIDKVRWEKVETKGKKPSERGYHSANLVGSVMVIIGGSDGTECYSDIWCLDLNSVTWKEVPYEGERYRRLSHTATQVGSCLFVVGGHNGSVYTGENIFFNLVSLQYEPRIVYGKPPSSRGYHSAIVTDSRLFIFGGFNGRDNFEDVYVLDLAGAAYLPQVMSFEIEVT